jgi:CRP-like cAMP-binding protein
MTLLDREPRTASATAIDDGYVLRLRHEPFLELMADRIEVVHGIVRSVAGHLRATSAEVARLSARVKELERQMDRQRVSGSSQPPGGDD